MVLCLCWWLQAQHYCKGPCASGCFQWKLTDWCRKCDYRVLHKNKINTEVTVNSDLLIWSYNIKFKYMVYFQLSVFTWASPYGHSTPNTAWRTSGHKQRDTLKQPYLRGVVDATLPGLPASTEVLWFTAKRILTLQVMSTLVTKHSNPTFFFFYTVQLIANKVILLEIVNTELTVSTSSWT